MKDDLQIFYEKEQKTRQGEVIIRRGDGSFQTKEEEGYPFYFWLNEKPKLFFKNHLGINDRDGEILCSYLYNFLGLDTVKVRPAMDIQISPKGKTHHEEGMLLEDLVQNRQTSHLVFSNNLEDLIQFYSVEDNVKGVKTFAKNLQARKRMPVTIDSNLELQLQQLFALDFFTYQRDRHGYNVGYIVEKNSSGYHIHLSKIFDNSQSFFFHNPYIFKILVQNHKDGEFEKLNEAADSHYFTKFFLHRKDEFYAPCYEEQIVKMGKKSKPFKQFLSKMLSLNLEDVFLAIQQDMPEYAFPKDKKAIASQLWNHRVDMIKNEMAKSTLPKQSASQNVETSMEQ